MSAFDELFKKVGEQRIEGGCDDCSAFQRLVKDEDGIWVLTTFHDNTCPYLLARKAGEPAWGCPRAHAGSLFSMT
jgi:hypothetical protein